MDLKILLLRGKDSESVYLNVKRLLNFMERHNINIDITLNERDKRLEITTIAPDKSIVVHDRRV